MVLYDNSESLTVQQEVPTSQVPFLRQEDPLYRLLLIQDTLLS